ncbi:hypothetical protein ACJ6WF_49395 [Streptomyces sp. MMS24-I2-30]|uniref:hypothetical protein n=1 Tax=Streptomyces sp. MMS24-I2-30 TaxID=3351564 RepID=UPI003896938E
MPDDLYQRYMAAHRADKDHRAACAACTSDAQCRDGRRIHARLAVLQDAYLERQRNQRGKRNPR